MKNEEKFIICKDEISKEKLLKQGFKLLNSKKNNKNELVHTFVNESTKSINFSKEDLEGLSYTNILHF